MISEYYFLIPKRKVTNEMINCSSAMHIDDLRTVKAPGWFKTEYAILKVPLATFEQVNYFDKYRAYTHGEISAKIDAILNT